jgi:hypothetical protein
MLILINVDAVFIYLLSTVFLLISAYIIYKVDKE